HVGRFAGELPGLGPGEVHEVVGLGKSVDMGQAFGGVDVVGVVVGAAVDLAAGEDGAAAALELVDDGEVGVGVAGLGAGAGGTAAQGGAAEGELVAHGPLETVDRVHGLLDEVVAADPGEVPPVADLELGVGPALLSRVLGEGAGVVVGVDGGDL